MYDPVVTVLEEIRGGRTLQEWADTLGLTKQACHFWLSGGGIGRPGLLALERTVTGSQYHRLLHALRERDTARADPAMPVGPGTEGR